MCVGIKMFSQLKGTDPGGVSGGSRKAVHCRVE